MLGYESTLSHVLHMFHLLSEIAVPFVSSVFLKTFLLHVVVHIHLIFYIEFVIQQFLSVSYATRIPVALYLLFFYFYFQDFPSLLRFSFLIVLFHFPNQFVIFYIASTFREFALFSLLLVLISYFYIFFFSLSLVYFFFFLVCLCIYFFYYFPTRFSSFLISFIFLFLFSIFSFFVDIFFFNSFISFSKSVCDFSYCFNFSRVCSISFTTGKNSIYLSRSRFTCSRSFSLLSSFT